MWTLAVWREWPATFLRIGLLTIAYAGFGVPTLLLAIPPGYAAPIFPPAGIMIAAGVIYGYRVLPAAFFGSLLMRLIAKAEFSRGQIALPSVALAIALAAMLQAAIGTRLVKAICGPAPALDTPATIIRFVLLCPLIALVSSSISISVLVLQGVIGLRNAPFAWWNWWVGDALGILVGSAIVFALFGKPREHWIARKWTVAAPLLAMIALAALIASVIARWENQRIEGRFAFDAQKLVNAFRNELRLDVLAAQVASHAQAKLDSGSESPRWLSDTPSIRSIGRVAISTSTSNGLASLQVLVDVSNRRREDERVLAMPSVRKALGRAMATEDVTASEDWAIGTGDDQQVEFLVWIPDLPEGTSSAPATTRFVYAVIDVEGLDPRRLSDYGGGLVICWIDRTGGRAPHRIAGPLNCEDPLHGLPLAREYPIPLWGRDWLIRVVATPTYAGALRSWSTWAFSAVTVLAIGATGVLLLLLTGRAQTISQLVEIRTAQLEQEKGALREAERARLVAEEATRAKDEFLSRMSHELRTPLNAILGFAQIVLGDPAQPLSAEQRRRVQHIETAGWHLLAMIDDLLDLSRIEAGTVRLSVEPIALDLLVDETMTMLSSAATLQGVVVRAQIDPEATRVLADATRLKQVLANLVSNGIKYNSRGGSVTIAARDGGADDVQIIVADNGHGMSPLQLSELFQPFNRLGRDLGPAQGTGIGLVVTKRLVELMKGRIDVTSVEGRGSTFTVTLPAAHANPLARPLTELDREQAAHYGTKRVAYIEDNLLNAEVMRALLALRPQIHLDVYARAADGLAAIRNGGFDLLLLDMNLPDARGIDVLRELKVDPSTQAMPVIIVSADTVVDRLHEALRAGALAYIAKPIERVQALEKIDGALQAV
jgi:signal transduction histidine kinase/CheY-like chemotaxis protein/integral membrane sensor domain MASE1